MRGKKKTGMVLGIGILAAGAACTWFWMKGNTKGQDKVFVSSLAALQSMEGSGTGNRYAGVVETQDVWELPFQEEKKVAEWFVEEGQEVEQGTVLFRYETGKTEENLAQAQLDLDTISNDKKNLNQQLAALDQAKKEATKEEQVSYDIEILNIQSGLKAKELEEINKAAEIAAFQTAIADASVSSPMGGVVKDINQTGEEKGADGTPAPLISVVGTGGLRVKGRINELNVAQISLDTPVLIRSRADANAIWKGNISGIDGNSPSISGGDGGDSGQGSTWYPFYVKLENGEGLMLGQHVYVEPDLGQDERKEGLWLDAYLIGEPDGSAYVWTDRDGSLEKREIRLGQYDPARDQYLVAEGLALTDWVTYPEEELREGMETIKSHSMEMGVQTLAGEDGISHPTDAHEQGATPDEAEEGETV